MGGMLLKGGPSVIDEITIEGGERIGASQIRMTSSLHVGQVWSSSLQENALQALRLLPQIRRVKFQIGRRSQRQVSVNILIEEREPYGIVSLTGRGLFWVDREGFLLGKVEGKAYLPIVTGVRTVATPQGEQLAPEPARRMLEEFFSLDGRTILGFTEVRYREYDLELHTREGGRVLLPVGGVKHYVSQLEPIISALGDSDWRTLDLRFEGEVILQR